MIAIIDCCGSNFASIQYALERLGQSVVLTHDHKVIQAADYVILPGVGHAKTAMEALKSHQLDQLIPTLTQPILGICLGMQLLHEFSEEGMVECLKIIPGSVKRFQSSDALIPHMGWNRLLIDDIAHNTNALFSGINPDDYVYYVHSFYAEPTAFTVAYNDYINHFSAVVNKDNFYGMQFHPEKSGKVGEQLLKNFINLSMDRKNLKNLMIQEALKSMKDFNDTGLGITGEEAIRWLNTWGTDAETSAPKVRKIDKGSK
ncbi:MULTISPECIES: imidazole glycerol phosphate synthase subunit HisH [Cysteiniphilum]|uniref:Imidazole glycerol phosphate synthase subunit HisH n=1 Tax=Cysteiniphilum litorale TaxID=2056700 RepID=A0A8J2Z3R9_9GAMM|nr:MULTISPECIES: imidazole glycerol phosphate synthase subunit HisH [Cysteiniphilum]GGF94899.1 imidazole glycerol phosphate synthase subunit HisH [Cysteiniphilum litorale]